MKLNLKELTPLGIDYEREVKWFIYGLIASSLFSLKFLVSLGNRYDELFTYYHHERILIEGAKMPDYIDILGNSLIGFFIISLSSTALIAYHYLYHYQGSKSIYLMKRLPDRFELIKRCVTLPVLIVTISLVVAFAILMIYLAIYFIATPEICLTPDQWQKIWQLR